MMLRLVVEHSPHPQRIREMRFEGGELAIGRGADCDWQLDDPDMFMSRKHCVIAGRDGVFTVTDASRGGVFLDGKETPLGAGVSARLEPGMRLRLGDVVLRVEAEAATAPASGADARPVAPQPSAPRPAASAQPFGFDGDDFFAQRAPAAPPPPRPDSLPQPFDAGPTPFAAGAAPARPAAPPQFDDPFTLDPVATPAAVAPPATPGFADFSFGPAAAEPAVTAPAAPLPDLAPLPDPAPAQDRARERQVPPPAAVDGWGMELPAPASPPDSPPPEPPPVAAAPVPPAPAAPSAPINDSALIAAFFAGMGIAPAATTPAEMEALGRRFRLLTEGLVTLLRTRAKEKSSVRVAQTVIGATDVNPLKFLVTTEDALGALTTPRGKGYLGPEDAINGAFRDLHDHQLRTWTALQSSLRRMIDRFDPAMFETEVEDVGLMKSLLSGSRSARLWQLYTERYRDIAKSAEDRFLGDIGADFRNAYEGNSDRRTTND